MREGARNGGEGAKSQQSVKAPVGGREARRRTTGRRAAPAPSIGGEHLQFTNPAFEVAVSEVVTPRNLKMFTSSSFLEQVVSFDTAKMPCSALCTISRIARHDSHSQEKMFVFGSKSLQVLTFRRRGTFSVSLHKCLK